MNKMSIKYPPLLFSRSSSLLILPLTLFHSLDGLLNLQLPIIVLPSSSPSFLCNFFSLETKIKKTLVKYVQRSPKNDFKQRQNIALLSSPLPSPSPLSSKIILLSKIDFSQFRNLLLVVKVLICQAVCLECLAVSVNRITTNNNNHEPLLPTSFPPSIRHCHEGSFQSHQPCPAGDCALDNVHCQRQQFDTSYLPTTFVKNSGHETSHSSEYRTVTSEG